MPIHTTLGDAFQMAFLPADFDAALNRWIELGAGPFFVMRNRVFTRSVFRGQLVGTAIDVALGQWGDVQIELIRQLDDGPSVYREWLDAGGRGVHHLGVQVPDLQRARHRVRDAGYEIVQEITSGEMDLFYAASPDRDQPIVECMAPPPSMFERFEMMKAARRAWDGVTDPVRAM